MPKDMRDLYFSDVATKISIAHRLFKASGARLKADSAVKEKLMLLVRLTDILQKQMRSMGMFELCGTCGSGPDGGCCSAEMANESDAVLLFMNMLLDCEVAIRRDDDFECCFLGERGCTLILKPIFCLNYNCEKIMVGSQKEDLAKLETATARLLGEQTIFENMILQSGLL
ncbi:MAG: hypothetical protein U9O82_07235 [Thermodesulfobacteriota bacterium]|nr:hypothetical protein [Thermodesulfobacteriota bacterium]